MASDSGADGAIMELTEPLRSIQEKLKPPTNLACKRKIKKSKSMWADKKGWYISHTMQYQDYIWPIMFEICQHNSPMPNSQILSRSHHSCKIKSVTGLGTRLLVSKSC